MSEELDDKHSLEVYVGELSSDDVIEMLHGKIGKGGVTCVERLGGTTLRLYFKENVSIDQFLVESVIVKNRELFFLRIGEKTQTIFVKGLPFSLSEKSLYDVVKRYGKVRSIGYERYAGYKPVCTGTRVLKMKLENSIPNFLRVGSFTAIVAYKNVVKVCRRCGGKSHIAKECNTPREDFLPGFPIHTRPIAPRTKVQFGGSTSFANAEVQTLLNSAAGKSFISSIQKTVLNSDISLTAITQGLKFVDINQNSKADSSSQVETPVVPAEKLHKKGKKGGNKVTLCPEEGTAELGVATNVSSEVRAPPTSGIAEGVDAVPNVAEISGNVTSTNKKKKKKKKKSNK